MSVGFDYRCISAGCIAMPAVPVQLAKPSSTCACTYGGGVWVGVGGWGDREGEEDEQTQTNHPATLGQMVPNKPTPPPAPWDR